MRNDPLLRNKPLLYVVGDMLESGEFTLRRGRQYRLAARRYERFAEATVKPWHVTAERLAEFLQWQLDVGIVRAQAVRVRADVATIARYADDSLCPLDREPPEANPDVSAWNLAAVVTHRLAPSGCYSQATVRTYRTACRRYSLFLGRAATAADVTPGSLKDFVRWQAGEGFSAAMAKRYGDFVATVVRSIAPEQLPLKYRRPRFADAMRIKRQKRQPFFSDATTEGTLEWIMVNEYFPAKSRIASKDTERMYAMATAKFSKHLGRPAVLTDLDDIAIGRWLRSMRDDGLAAQTIIGYAKNLRAFWNWCAKRRKVEHFPTFADPPAPRRIPRALTVDQLRALVAACDKMPGRIGGVQAAAWWRAIILTVLDTGERKGAVMQLRWEYFDPATGVLESPAEIRKGGCKAMVYRLRPETVEAIESIRQPPRETIFAWDGHPSTYQLHVYRLWKAAGIPIVRGKTGLQQLRRSFATHIEAAGGDATAALAHTARKVTEQSYLDERLINRPAPNLLLPTFGGRLL